MSSGDVAYPDKFCYDPLPGDTSMRLLTIVEQGGVDDIHCKLITALSDEPYICLSYVWGPESPDYQITVNGKKFVVRQNLYNFLRKAKKCKLSMPLWIDAICINQNDIAEKNTQVRRMGSTYAKACKVLVELGLSDEYYAGLRRVMTFIDDLCYLTWSSGTDALHGEPHKSEDGRPQHNLEHTPSEIWRDEKWTGCVHAQFIYEVWHRNASHSAAGDRPTLVDLMKDMLVPIAFNTPPSADITSDWLSCSQYLQLLKFMPAVGEVVYWNRAWIVQELANANSAEVFLAEGHIDVRSLLECYHAWLCAVEPPTFSAAESDNPIHAMYSFDKYRLIWDLLHSFGVVNVAQEKMTLLAALEITEHRKCRDLRDKLYSVLSFVDQGDQYTVDYAIRPLELFSSVISFMRRTKTFPEPESLSECVWALFIALAMALPLGSDEKLQTISIVKARGADILKQYKAKAFWASAFNSGSKWEETEMTGNISDTEYVDGELSLCFTELVNGKHLLWEFRQNAQEWPGCVYELTGDGDTWYEIDLLAACSPYYEYGKAEILLKSKTSQ